ncbi:MAG: hypothetical protein AABZ47_16155 [Planctomycetota bacterium]
MTLQWDLSDTPLFRCETRVNAPTEGELFVVLVGLLLLEGIGYQELAEREVEFRPDQQDQLAEVFEYRIPELVSEFGGADALRVRLSELVGIRVSRMGNTVV